MPEIDLYEIGTELLGGEQADATIARLGTLQGIIDRVNAALAARGGLTPAAALNHANKKAGTLRQPRQPRPLSGAADAQTAGAPPPPQPVHVPFAGLTPAAVLTVIHAAHAPGRQPRTSALAAQDLVMGELLGRGRAGVAIQAGGIAVPEAGRLLGKARSDGMEDERSPRALSRKTGGAGAFFNGSLTERVELPRDPFPWRAVGLEPEAKRRVPSRQNMAGGARNAGGLFRIGALTGRSDGTSSRRDVPLGLMHETGRADVDGANAGTVIALTWRRLQRLGRADVAEGDAAYSRAAGMGAGGFGAIGAIMTATGAAGAPSAARGQLPGRGPPLADGMIVPGATPDRPLYTRIVIDQSPIPTTVTNHDALTSATVNTIAQHQSAMPTAPTGINNNLVPPVPGVPVPGSYLP